MNVALRASVTANNTGLQDGDAAQVLIDGSDTPITANGLTGYVPTPGDRLLVARIGGMVEILQFLSRGTVPYISGADLSDMQASIDNNTQQVSNLSVQQSTTSQQLTDYMSSNDATISGLQSGYDVLNGLGNAGVQEDYMWVGDDPAMSTVKTVQISQFVQAALYAGDGPTLGTLLDLVDTTTMGDTTTSPKATFYTYFTNVGLSARAI